MATNVRLEFKSEGFREILMSQNCADVCKTAGEAIAARATTSVPYVGALGYEYQPATLNYGGGRAGGYVAARRDADGNLDFLTLLAEANQKTLTKAVRP